MIQQINKLSSEQFEELEEALVSAFVSVDGLKRMYRFVFNESLNASIHGDTVQILVFNLIEWAESKGKINELIEGAYKHNRTNPLLNKFVESVTLKTEHHEEKHHSKYFLPNVPITQITPVDILDIRADRYKQFYYERDFDTDIYNIALRGESILLIGNSLAGKTRAILELLKKIALDFPKTLILFPQNMALDTDIRIPLQEGYRHIAFIEDIDDYYKDEKYDRRNYDKMIRELTLNHVQIFATCRTGPEYKEYKRLSKGKAREIFRIVPVEKVSKEIVNSFDENIVGNIEQSEFDGNIGSIFMDILKMKERYEALEKDKSEEAKLAVLFLRALRAFYFASNFSNKSTYNAEAVKDYCLRLSVGKFASSYKMADAELGEQMIKLQRKEKKQEIEKFEQKLITALSLLESDEESLNFIEQKGIYIKTEEVYLEKIVKYNPFTIVKNIDDLYDAKGEKEKRGFYVKTNNYNLILKNHDYSKAIDLFNGMKKKGIIPNADTYSILIQKADTYQTALLWFQKMERLNIPINEGVLIEMICKCDSLDLANNYIIQLFDILSLETNENSSIDYQYQSLTDIINAKILSPQEVETYFDIFYNKNIPISSFVFNRFIRNKQYRITTTTSLVNWLEKYQIVPDKLTICELIQKTNSVEEGLALIQDEKFKDIPVDIAILNRLIGKSKSVEEGLALIQNDKFKDIRIDTSILNGLIGKSKSVEEGLHLIQSEMFKNIRVDATILNGLIRMSKSIEEDLDLIHSEKFKNIVPNAATINLLILKSKFIQEDLDLIQSEKFKNIVLNTTTLNLLIRKSKLHEEDLELLQNERLKNIFPNTITLNLLISKSKSFEDSLGLLRSEKFKKVSPDTTTLNLLISKSKSFEETSGLLQSEKFKNVLLNIRTLNQVFMKSKSVEEVIDLMQREKFKNISPSTTTLNLLIVKTKSVEEVLVLIQDEKFKAIPPNTATLNFVIRKTKSLDEALSLIQDEKFKKLPVDRVTLHILISNTKSLDEGLESMRNEIFKNLRPDEKTLHLLISKTKSVEEALTIFDNKEFKGMTIDRETLNRLIEQSNSDGLDSIASLLDDEQIEEYNAESKEETMTLDQLKETVREFIRKAKTEAALKELLNWAHRNNDDGLTDKVTELTGQLKKMNNDVMYGYITDNEADVKQRRLVKTVLDLLKDMEGEKKEVVPPPVVAPSKPADENLKVDKKALKILMLTALPAKTVEIDTYKEFAKISKELQGNQAFNLMIENHVNQSEFKKFTETNKPDVLHFSGHGIKGGEKGGIVLQNDNKNGYELLSPDKLDFLFQYFKRSFQIQAVILNACLSEEQAMSISRHVPYVVGTTDEIEDEYSIAFSVGFYFKLVESNRDFEAAFDSGRTEAFLKGAKRTDFVFYKGGKIWEIDTPQ